MIEDIAKSLTGAMTAVQLANIAIAEFEVHATAHNWVGAEDARFRAISNLEAHFDHIAAAYKQLQRS